MDRRTFLQKSALTAGVVAGSSQVFSAAHLSHLFRDQPMIGIQIGAVSFVDEGTDTVLDRVQQLAGANTLFIPVFAFNRGLAGRRDVEDGFPDHGVLEEDAGFTGGYYASMHEAYYRHSLLKPEHVRARELGEYDVLADVIPKARQRGMKVIAFFADNYGSDKPFADQLGEVDILGNSLGRVNFRNPDYRTFLRALMKDCIESYDIDGLLWRSERLGPMSNVLNFNHYNTPAATSFDPFTVEAAEQRGIRVDKAREGYLELMRFVDEARSGKAPIDGYYVTFWRILFEYPEILAWHQLFVDSLREMYREVYAFAKNLKPDLQVGWALSFKGLNNPFYRSRQDLQELGNYSDFLKIVMYNTVGGSRFDRVIERVSKTLYGDLKEEEILLFICRIMGYSPEEFTRLSERGISPEMVKSETQRALAGAEGTPTEIWPGIDVDIPSGEGRQVISTPEKVKQSVLAAFAGGAKGIILARKYSEMNLSSLAGAGEALAELGFK